MQWDEAVPPVLLKTGTMFVLHPIVSSVIMWHCSKQSSQSLYYYHQVYSLLKTCQYWPTLVNKWQWKKDFQSSICVTCGMWTCMYWYSFLFSQLSDLGRMKRWTGIKAGQPRHQCTIMCAHGPDRYRANTAPVAVSDVRNNKDDQRVREYCAKGNNSFCTV